MIVTVLNLGTQGDEGGVTIESVTVREPEVPITMDFNQAMGFFGMARLFFSEDRKSVMAELPDDPRFNGLTPAVGGLVYKMTVTPERAQV